MFRRFPEFREVLFGGVVVFRTAGLLLVILSAAKDLIPIASGDEVLRCAQDDGYERAARP
jgi:hypothetical protein